MKKNSYAKLNLALNVTNKQKPKDLHELDMVNLTLSLKDTVNIKFLEEESNKTIICCNNEKVPLNQDNLVYKVIEKFKKNFHLSFACIVTINKNIPLEAGLAGGSSNAAATLDILNSHFKTNMTVLQKIKFIQSITSDGPYMVVKSCCRVKGNGNIIEPIKTKFKANVLLVKPFSGCNTKEVYSNLDYKNLVRPNINKVVSSLKENNFIDLANYVDNSLCDSACKINEDIKDILNRLKACGFEIVSLTGSGSTCFAISNRKKPYKLAKQLLHKENYELIKVFKTKN